MKWPFGPAATTRLVGPWLAILGATWRFDVRHRDRWSGLLGRPFVFLLWHEALWPLLWHHRRQGVAIVVSDAPDGHYLGAYAERLGYRCLYGSSHRGGVKALLGAVGALEGGTPVAFTPDGPRGPHRIIKPGILAAAARVRVPILPVHATADRAWRLATWDRFMVPKPFARVRVGYGNPFEVGDDESGLETAADRASIELETLDKEMAWQYAAVTGTD